MRKSRRSQVATSLTLNTPDLSRSIVNLWVLRLLCHGGLWANVSTNDFYDHDPLLRFYWGKKLRMHLHLGGLLLNNEKFLKTGHIDDVKAGEDLDNLKRHLVVPGNERVRFLVKKVWPMYEGSEGLVALEACRPSQPNKVGVYCRAFLKHPTASRLLEGGIPHCLTRSLRHLESTYRDEISGLSEAFAANLRLLRKTFKLSDLEVRILAFVFCAQSDQSVSNLLRSLLDYTEQGLSLVVNTLAVALAADRDDVKTALDPQGNLFGIGLLDYGDSGSDFCDNLCPGPILSSSTMSVKLSLSKLLKDSFLPAPHPTLSLEHFPHVPMVGRVLLPYLKSALTQKRKGVNILFYGPAGSGKTELTRILAKELGLTAYEVQFAERQEFRGERISRIMFWKVAGSVLSRNSNELLVLDEAEDIFNDMGTLFFSGRTNKGEINRLLEENPVVTLWTANSIRNIDPAMLRRFNMVIEVKSPGLAYRREMIDKAFDHRLSKGTTERLALTENLSSAVIRSISDIVRETGKTSESPSEDEIIEMADQMLKAQHMGRVVDNNTLLPELYEPQFVNSELDLDNLLEGLRAAHCGRLCIYGPPGTGKSAYAAYVARELGIPLMRKTGAELTSCYVGVTEKLIADAFETAQRDGALLLLDEVDSFLRDRQATRYSWEVTAVNEMLAQMERYGGYFIATTNLKDDLDPACLRRFDLKTKFDYLRPEQAVAMAKAYAGKLGLTDGVEALDRVADFGNLTPGDFAAVGRQATFRKLSGTEDFVERLAVESNLKAAGMGNPKRWIL